MSWEIEPNDDCDSANGPLVSGKDYYGYSDDQWDCFMIDVRAQGRITTDLTDYTGAGMQLQLRDQYCNLIRYDTMPPYHIEYDGSMGRYFVCIYTESGYNSDTPYMLRTMFP